GGTEGNNLALKGIALQFQSRGKHIVTTEVEHASVYETCKALENLGFEITYLPVNEQGVVRVEDVEAAIGPETILVSIMQVNNEIGAVQPIEEIGKKLAQYPKLFFHVDAVQGLGKVPLSLLEASIDLCTFSGHKIHGLKGTGLLYVKQGTSLFPLFHGGGQEQSFRSGTENVAGNVSFVRALRLIQEKVSNKRELLQNLKEQLRSKLSALEGVYVNSPADGAPHILNASVPGLKPEVVIHALYDKGAIISTQSACSSKRADKSRVLAACGLTESRVTSGLRMSLSYDTTEKEIQDFVALFTTVVQNLTALMCYSNMKYDNILIRYGELGLKGKNIKQFIIQLQNNIRYALREYTNIKVTRSMGRLFVVLNGEAPEPIIEKCQRIFGIYSLSLAIKVSN